MKLINCNRLIRQVATKTCRLLCMTASTMPNCQDRMNERFWLNHPLTSFSQVSRPTALKQLRCNLSPRTSRIDADRPLLSPQICFLLLSFPSAFLLGTSLPFHHSHRALAIRDAFKSGAVRDSGHQPAIPKLESSSKQLGESQSSRPIRCRPPHYPVLVEQTPFPRLFSPMLTISHHRKDRVKDPV